MRFRVEWQEELSSTNTVLLDRAGAPDFHGTVLAAHRQTAGRGRLDRRWQSHPGNLACSIGFCFPKRAGAWAAHLPIALGVAVFDVVAALLPEAERGGLALKWPNDLQWQERKLMGMLSQAKSQGEKTYLVLGLGFNVMWAPADLPAISLTALPLREEWRAKVQKEWLLAQILLRLKDLEAELEQMAAIRAAWELRAPYLQREIAYGSLENPNTMRMAIAVGLDSSCGLRVRHRDGSGAVLSAEEISLRWSTSAKPAGN